MTADRKTVIRYGDTAGEALLESYWDGRTDMKIAAALTPNGGIQIRVGSAPARLESLSIADAEHGAVELLRAAAQRRELDRQEQERRDAEREHQIQDLIDVLRGAEKPATYAVYPGDLNDWMRSPDARLRLRPYAEAMLAHIEGITG